MIEVIKLGPYFDSLNSLYTPDLNTSYWLCVGSFPYLQLHIHFFRNAYFMVEAKAFGES